MKLTLLSDSALLESLKCLVMQEKQCTANVVAHLAEVDRRKAYLPWASSLFVYATEHLHLSEAAAYKRITAARLVQRCPAVLDALFKGDVHLGALNALAPYVSCDNCLELLAEAKYKTTRAIELLVAARFPKQDVPQTIRQLPMNSPRGELMAPSAQGLLVPASNSTSAQASPPSPPPTQGIQRPPPAQLAPLSAERYKVQFTASRALHDKLRLAQKLLSHRIAPTDVATIIEAALDRLIDEVMLERFATKKKSARAPRATTVKTAALQSAPKPEPQKDLQLSATPATDVSASARSRYIPAPVRRQVLARDGLRCTHVDPQGRRCTEAAMLELHHLKPFARGGTHDPSNLTLRCRGHNVLAAQADYGADFMRRYVREQHTRP